MSDLTKFDYEKILIEALEKTISEDGKRDPLAKEIDLSLPLDTYLEDSLERLEFVMALEDAFGLVLDVKKIAECKTLSDIINLTEL
jgi:acyl carrier protein